MYYIRVIYYLSDLSNEYVRHPRPKDTNGT